MAVTQAAIYERPPALAEVLRLLEEPGTVVLCGARVTEVPATPERILRAMEVRT